jgi:Probable molybdopterin binding domain
MRLDLVYGCRGHDLVGGLGPGEPVATVVPAFDARMAVVSWPTLSKDPRQVHTGRPSGPGSFGSGSFLGAGVCPGPSRRSRWTILPTAVNTSWIWVANGPAGSTRSASPAEPSMATAPAASSPNALQAAIASGARIVMTCGGTGIGPRDRTSDVVARHLAFEIPGIAEEFRRRGLEHSAPALVSREIAGVVGPMLGYIVEQLDGNGHA